MAILPEQQNSKPSWGHGVLNEYGTQFNYCRDQIIIASGANQVTVLTVLGKVTATGKYVPLAPASADGSEAAAGIMFSDVDATTADQKAVALVRGPSVISPDSLVWPAGITVGEKATAISELLALGIKSLT